MFNYKGEGMKQCGTCRHNPNEPYFKKCKVTLYNYTVVDYGFKYMLRNDLTGQENLINCKHWEKREDNV